MSRERIVHGVGEWQAKVGWFGAVLIVPNFGGVEYPDNLKILTTDIILGIVGLVIAVKLKRLAKKGKHD